MRPSISDVKEWVTTFQEIWKLGQEIIRTASSRKNHASRIPTRVAYFARKEEAEIRGKLKILCKGRNSNSVVKTLLLHGPSGYGKHYSAAKVMDTIYTSRITNSFVSRTDQGKTKFFLQKPAIRWTLNATNTRTLFESYSSLAKEIGLIDEAKAAYWELPLHSRTSEGRQYQMYLHDRCEKDAYDEALEQIYEGVMRALGQNDSWVILIEGSSEKVAPLRRFWPQPGDNGFGNGLVIMTTGDNNNSKLLFGDEDDSVLQKVYIGKMTNHDAIQFLQSKTDMKATGSDTKYAKDIAVDMLRCNPQDIAKFGKFVKNYKEETERNLTYKDLAGTETETPNECMLLLEMTRKNQEKILKFLACCSVESDYLPLQCLESCFKEARETVKQSNFVNVLERDGVKVVTMHERDHKTLRDLLTGRKLSTCEETWPGFFWQLVKQGTGLIRDETNKIIPPTLSASDVLQAIKCLSNNCKEPLQQRRDQDFIMLHKILPHLKTAMELGKFLIPQSDGEENPLIVADGHACLGELLLFVGESEEARKNLEIALRGFKDYSGPENVLLDKANVLHFLGEAYCNSYLGDPSKGEEYLKQALKEKQRHYKGKADPQVAFTLRSLANVLNELGKHSEAIGYSKRAVDIYYENGHHFKQEYGYSLSTLGSSYRYLGQYVQAEKCLKEALKIFRSVDSPSKLRMGVTLSRLASVQRYLEKLDESIKSLMEAREMLGNNDIYIAIILSKLSVVYRHKGDSKNSLAFAEEAAEITDKHHGRKDHPVIATALLNLGHAQSDTGRVDDAERNLNKALQIYKELHGENHRIIAANLNYLGYAYLQMGKVQKAKETLERAVEIMDNLSPPHPEKANSLKRLSKACLILGDTVKSADLANRALKIYKETHGNMMQNREVRKCTLRVAYACSKLGFFSKAKEYLKGVELGFSEENKAHPEYAVFLRTKTEMALDNLEFSWPKDEEGIQEIFTEAGRDLNNADEIIQRSLGSDHQQYAFLKREKARLYVLTGYYEKACKEIDYALAIAKNYQRRDLEAGFLLIRADAEGKLQLSSGRKESLATADQLHRNTLGDNHPMVATTLQKRCQKNIDQKNLTLAEEYLEASAKICEILKSNLRLQLQSSSCDFLTNYSLDRHPVLKRQQQLERTVRGSPVGAWFR